MANFLELCQRVASESGVIPGQSQPASVVGQTGMLGRIVTWVKTSWVDIQLMERDWRWMNMEFSGNIVDGVQRYDSTAVGIASRFSEWAPYGTEGQGNFSLYDPAIGAGDDSELTFLSFAQMRSSFLRGEQTEGRPAYYSWGRLRELIFAPIPDKTYTIKGMFLRSPQELSVNTSTPECPGRFHDAIVYLALLKTINFDEGMAQYPFWKGQFDMYMSYLRRDQLPRHITSGALA